MSTMLDYLDKYGNIPFNKDPFNEVDNLIICQLSYLDFEELMPQGCKPKSIARIASEYFSFHSAEEIYAEETLLSGHHDIGYQKIETRPIEHLKCFFSVTSNLNFKTSLFEQSAHQLSSVNIVFNNQDPWNRQGNPPLYGICLDNGSTRDRYKLVRYYPGRHK